MELPAEMFRVPVVIYRGGTSKAVFIKEYDLPAAPALRDRVVLAVFGSPDKRQIDGLGGADPLTSKLAIVGPPSRPDAHVDYTFGQVDILSPTVYYGAVCGNITAAVGPYAIEEGFVRAEDGETRIRIHATNIRRIIEAVVPTPGRTVQVSGGFVMDGVPGTGARIELNWRDTAGANTGSVLPTGHPVDVLEVEGYGSIEASLVDVGNVGIFVRARDLGLHGTEAPEEVDANPELLKKCDAIAGAAMKKLGKLVLLTYVGPPAPYKDHVTGQPIRAEDVDLVVRMILMGKMHKTYAASMINCCGTAAVIPGTVVHEAASGAGAGAGRVRLGHPAGTAELEITVAEHDGQLTFPRIAVYRTARRILEGYAFVRREVLGAP
ncbi:MAG: PrpF domain-containing protein [bacterium]